MKELAKALIEAQSNMGPLLKTAKNPHFNSSYAPLKEVVSTAQKHFFAAGISPMESYSVEDGVAQITLRLTHVESGESLSSTLPLQTQNPSNPQQLVSCSTYMRRVLWIAAAGLAPEDDDGNAAAQAKPTPKGKVANQDASKAAVASKKKTLADTLKSVGIAAKDQAEWIGVYCEHYAETKQLNESDLDALIIEAQKQLAEITKDKLTKGME